PFVHKFRRLAVRVFFGPDQFSTSQSDNPTIKMFSNRINILADRIGLLESNVNWRLFGLPARVTNIKLEQAKLLSASGDVEWAIEQFRTRQTLCSDYLEKVIQEINFTTPMHSLMYIDDTQAELDFFHKHFKAQSEWTLIEDTANLFHIEKSKLNFVESELVKILQVDACSAAALMGDQDAYHFIWFTNLLERITPIQATVLLGRAAKSISKQEGICAGVFQDYLQTDAGLYWADPRRLRPLTKTFLTSIGQIAGFSNIKFYDCENGCVLFVFKVK
ncbi:MAG: hypothetical protein K2X39_05155, partial [Silvanigrellaceae bacterium]|nr:hypothetical protein [Silvanigrellaceae bacterium]